MINNSGTKIILQYFERCLGPRVSIASATIENDTPWVSENQKLRARLSLHIWK